MLSRFSHVRLFATPWTIALQSPLPWDSPCWNGLPRPSPGDLPHLGIEPRSPASYASKADSLLLSQGGISCLIGHNTDRWFRRETSCMGQRETDEIYTLVPQLTENYRKRRLVALHSWRPTQLGRWLKFQSWKALLGERQLSGLFIQQVLNMKFGTSFENFQQRGGSWFIFFSNQT